MPHLTDWSDTAVRLQDEHRAIVTALEIGNGEQAAALTEQHILGYARLTDLT